ncbi:amidohydrolase [Amycolatopsis sp. K13G38]|uniref:Amidohydrolase n=1 Tax=Amycolatopsis acididurans TaxID=2724524 RepID=A0ABX1JFT7_9PSEU|nr:amidohydrolase family protein [Amycolatopsis acididurans]NKQ58061.1 amidohydrolase [Amycolatopsis acididurans]
MVAEDRARVIEFLRAKSPDGIIDVYVNGNAPELGAKWSGEGAPAGLDIFGKTVAPKETVEQLVEQMDLWGIKKVLLSTPTTSADRTYEDDHRWALDVVQKYPDRFALAVRADPNDGVRAVRALDSMVRNDGARALRITPVRWGKPINDKIYYPLLSKCAELDIPVTVTTGISAPRLPSEIQNPIYFDEVCYFFPELTIVSTHGGEPWQNVLVKLMAKWPNLYHMISAFVPKYYPRETVDFLRSSRGRDKVMFATDYPLVQWDRAMLELADLDLPDAAWRAFLHDNADRVFWRGGED